MSRVTLPEDLLKDLDTDRLQEIVDNEAKFVEFFSGLELDDVRYLTLSRTLSHSLSLLSPLSLSPLSSLSLSSLLSLSLSLTLYQYKS